MPLTQEQIDELEALQRDGVDIQSATVAGQTVARRSLKEIDDHIQRHAPVNILTAIGRVKTIPPSPG